MIVDVTPATGNAAHIAGARNTYYVPGTAYLSFPDFHSARFTYNGESYVFVRCDAFDEGTDLSLATLMAATFYGKARVVNDWIALDAHHDDVISFAKFLASMPYVDGVRPYVLRAVREKDAAEYLNVFGASEGVPSRNTVDGYMIRIAVQKHGDNTTNERVAQLLAVYGQLWWTQYERNPANGNT